jgi:hypothetical protein
VYTGSIPVLASIDLFIPLYTVFQGLTHEGRHYG